MLDVEAKVLLQQDMLITCYHTIGFLHGCLTDKKHYSYTFPENTSKVLEEILELTPIPEPCHHSFRQKDCDVCNFYDYRENLLKEARKVLNLKVT